MKILIINAGSSSLKYQLINMENQEVLAKGNCERVGLSEPFIGYKNAEGSHKFPGAVDHVDAVEKVLAILTNAEYGVLKSLDEIDAIAHRVVTGGYKFTESVLVTDEVLALQKSFDEFAPLHNPANVKGVEACRNVMPNTPAVLVFDTAFHSTMPKKAYTYAIDMKDAEANHIRKYGFHGTSHRFITLEAARVLGKKVEDVNLVIAHMGNGSSITAVKNGQSVDTTMGYTPLQGLVMGTRSGDIDPALVAVLAKKKNMSADEVITYLNKECGVLGVSGVDSDMRSVENAAAEGNERAQLALDMVAYAAKKHIGSYLAVLNGADAIVFTGGVGENADLTRADVIGNMSNLGVELDADRNKNFKRGQIELISTDSSKTKIYVIPTNEELMMAIETQEIVKSLK